MDNFTDIAVFVRVVETGSFTAAAESLDLSKAVVSKYVGRLEQRLGARLLNRTTRRLTLTEAGELLYRRGALAIEELLEAERDVAQLAGGPRGHLRVTAPVYFGSRYLIPRLRVFRERYPEITVELDLDDQIVDLVEGRFDVGVRVTEPADSSLVIRRLLPCDMVLCATPEYLRRHGTPSTPGELRDHECLTYSLDAPVDEWRFQAPDGRWTSVTVRGWFRCNNGAALKSILLDGLGVHLFPRFFVDDELASGQLVELLPDYLLPALTMYAVFPSRRHLVPKVRAFVDFLVEQFSR